MNNIEKLHTKGFSEKSQNYFLTLKKKEGTDYTNLIIEECRSIIHDVSHTGYCFNNKQLHDIKQILLFEKIETTHTIFYDEIQSDKIDYITIEQKNIFINKKVPTKCYKKKTNIRKKRNRKTDLKKSIEQKESIKKEIIDFEEFKHNILEHYGFI